ncbi:MAG TPA: hypothetical protein VFU81_13130, partial [Thermomicrobiales bacterium]|nr:hypothetical protein [Thermomicrobiales bacterium]
RCHRLFRRHAPDVGSETAEARTAIGMISHDDLAAGRMRRQSRLRFNAPERPSRIQGAPALPRFRIVRVLTPAPQTRLVVRSRNLGGRPRIAVRPAETERAMKGRETTTLA